MKSFVRKFTSLWQGLIIATVGPITVVLVVNLLLGKNWFSTLPFLSVILLTVLFSYATLYFTVAFGFFLVMTLERHGWLIPDITEEDDPDEKPIDVFKIAIEVFIDELKKDWDKYGHGEDKTEALGPVLYSIFIYGFAGFILFLVYDLLLFILTYP